MWLELDPLFANKTLLKIDLASSTEFSFSVIMIERHCSDALRNLFDVVCLSLISCIAT